MKKLPLSLLGLIFLFATITSAQVAQQARNFQINETHTGSTSVDHLIPPLKVRWTVNLGLGISYPLIADGRVFVSQGTMLYALDATNGAVLWSFALGGNSPFTASCYENGRVFSVNRNGTLRAFDAATGSVIWTTQLPGQSFFTSAPSVYQGVIYLGGSGSGGTVYAVNATSGAVL